MSSVVQNLKLAQIRTDGGTQPRTALNEATVADYAEAITDGAKFPPVTVFHDGSDYWLADGFHRLFAHKKIGALDVEVEIRQGTKRDAVLHSVGANAEHGLRRTNEDKRKAVSTLLNDSEWSKWSNREIARCCTVSESLVRSLRENAVTDAPVARTYTTKHGTEAVMKTANIGKRPAARKVPAKRTLDQARPTDIPEESRADELNDARYTITELAEEADELRDRLAVAAMDATDEEKLLAQTTIAELRGRVRTLEAELDAARSMRDSLLVESAEKTKQILYWRKKAEKVAA